MDGVVRLGRRIMVQRRVDDGVDGGRRLTEVVGVVIGARPEAFTLQGRSGIVVDVPTTGIMSVHAVPPPRTGRGPAHLAVSVDDLERVTHDGWRSPDEASLGAWVLRAAGGVTGRANSVLAVGDPGLPLSQALGRVRRWYAERALPTAIQVSGPVGFVTDTHPVGSASRAVGLTDRVRVLVMTASRQGAFEAGSAYRLPDGLELMLTHAPDGAWLTAYAGSKDHAPALAGFASDLLVSAPAQVFGSVVGPTGDVVGIGRMALSPGWAGVFGVWTAPGQRRRGVASALVAGLLDAADASVRAVYLQVEVGNTGAIASYRRLGFVDHHEYVCLADPAEVPPGDPTTTC
jgi:ribosomal protein S18 acetylase RimI-like enzyme